MNFTNLKIHEWQQFQSIDIDFHDRLTILTGANGSGKTTILNLLATHCGWNINPLATPRYEKRSGVIRFFSRLFNGEDKNQDQKIGTLTYDNNSESDLLVSSSPTIQYQINIINRQNVNCFYIPSHRAVYRYQPIENIPTTRKDKQTAFTEVDNTFRNLYFGSGGSATSYYMKNTLIGWVIRGYGVQDDNRYLMPRDVEQSALYEGFQNVLKKVLPATLGFNELEIRNMEVVFVCNEGRDEFVLETASGGISALIDMAWEIYMYSTKERGEYTVLVDEVENHLHPTMQRHVLSDLLNAFPNARFIVTTHNPLVVGSVRDSNIYVLKYNEFNKIESQKLDFEMKPKTASEILDEVLGVSFTMPIWAEEALQNIVTKFTTKEMSEDDFKQMRGELSAVGLERLMTNAVENVIKGKND